MRIARILPIRLLATLLPAINLIAGCQTDVAAASDAAPIDKSDAENPPDASVQPIKYPIDHIVVMVKENHTFDNYFGSFPGAEGTQIGKNSKGPVPVTRPPQLLFSDLCHSHECALADWNGGKMDHWDLGDPKHAADNLAFAQYTEADIPNYWQYARSFVLCDHFFSSMMGPSFPGHSFVLSAQAGWATGNPTQSLPWGCDDKPGTTVPILDNGTCAAKDVYPCFDFPTVPDLLPKSLTWKFYGSTEPPLIGTVWSMFAAVKHLHGAADYKDHVVDLSKFDADLASDNFPNVVYLIDQDAYSEHPPLGICAGENWSVRNINKLMQSKYWGRMAILLTYDDFGGWYDHVPPPKFIETIFHLPSLHSLDPAAQDGPDTNDLTEAFDFTQKPNPPLVLQPRDCGGQR